MLRLYCFYATFQSNNGENGGEPTCKNDSFNLETQYLAPSKLWKAQMSSLLKKIWTSCFNITKVLLHYFTLKCRFEQWLWHTWKKKVKMVKYQFTSVDRWDWESRKIFSGLTKLLLKAGMKQKMVYMYILHQVNDECWEGKGKKVILLNYCGSHVNLEPILKTSMAFFGGRTRRSGGTCTEEQTKGRRYDKNPQVLKE